MAYLHHLLFKYTKRDWREGQYLSNDPQNSTFVVEQFLFYAIMEVHFALYE